MNPSRLIKLLSLMLLAISLVGCTIIRYVDNDDNGGGGNGELDPKVVDILILVDLPRGAANIMPGYASFLEMVMLGLAEQNVIVNRSAVAPMYRTQSERAPLLFGAGDPYSDFSGLHDAMLYYVSDTGLSHLDGQVDADGENLAGLGMNLDRETVFNPHTAPPESRPYYDEAADGFVVFYLTGSSRKCSHNDPNCALDGKTPAAYFTETDEDDNASWLTLPGPTGHSPSKIMHVSISTAEGVDFDTFAESCLRESNFPANHLDVLEPSEHHEYFGPLMAGLDQAGGNGMRVDLCTAFSSRAEHSAVHTAGQIVRMLY